MDAQIGILTGVLWVYFLPAYVCLAAFLCSALRFGFSSARMSQGRSAAGKLQSSMKSRKRRSSLRTSECGLCRGEPQLGLIFQNACFVGMEIFLAVHHCIVQV
jgi:hypothetical protein